MKRNSSIDFELEWRSELQKVGQYLLKMYNTSITRDKLFLVEKKVFTCFFHIRQNSGFYLSSQKTYPKEIRLISYPIKDKTKELYDYGNRYDVYKGQYVYIDLYELCHAFVHINIKSQFVPTNQGVLGFFFSSDKDTNNRLFYIQMCKLAQIFISLSQNKEICITEEFDKKKELYKFNYSDLWSNDYK
jgi:hypothetical protein